MTDCSYGIHLSCIIMPTTERSCWVGGGGGTYIGFTPLVCLSVCLSIRLSVRLVLTWDLMCITRMGNHVVVVVWCVCVGGGGGGGSQNAGILVVLVLSTLELAWDFWRDFVSHYLAHLISENILNCSPPGKNVGNICGSANSSMKFS